jgi:hypothetical protein
MKKPSSQTIAPDDSTKWKCNWIECISGCGLSVYGWCSVRGEWDNSKCPKFEKSYPLPDKQKER